MASAFSISSILVKMGLRKPVEVTVGEVGKRTRPRTAAEIETLVQVLLSAREARRQQAIHEEIESFRSHLDAAMRHVDAAELADVPDAQGLLERMRKTQHAGQLMTFLMAMRDAATGMEATALNRQVASVASIVGDNKIAFDALKQVLVKAPKDLDALTQLGHQYVIVSDFDNAKKAFTRVMTYSQAVNDEREEAIAWSNLGLVHHALNDMDKAEFMHGKALEVDKRLKRIEGMANDYGNLGIIYLAQKRTEHAERMFREAIKMEEKLPTKHARPEALAITFGNLGLLLYQKGGQMEEAEQLLRKALDINERFGRLGGVAASYTNLGLIRLRQKDRAQATEYFTKALALARKIGRVKIAEKVEEWLADLAKSKEKTDKKAAVGTPIR